MLGVLVFPRATAALVAAHAPPDARLVAVDAGAKACLDAGRVPSLVVGDMDSVPEGVLADALARGASIERHPSAKRDTDGALALSHVRDCETIRFVGPGGGRADHAYANLHLLARAAERSRVVAYDEDATTWIATPERPVELSLAEGALVSMIPFDPVVEGITYEGMLYALSDATMHAGDPYGVSNVAATTLQRIRVRAGRLVIMAPHEA